jgi:hypothetical protein
MNKKQVHFSIRYHKEVYFALAAFMSLSAGAAGTQAHATEHSRPLAVRQSGLNNRHQSVKIEYDRELRRDGARYLHIAQRIRPNGEVDAREFESWELLLAGKHYGVSAQQVTGMNPDSELQSRFMNDPTRMTSQQLNCLRHQAEVVARAELSRLPKPYQNFAFHVADSRLEEPGVTLPVGESYYFGELTLSVEPNGHCNLVSAEKLEEAIETAISQGRIPQSTQVTSALEQVQRKVEGLAPISAQQAQISQASEKSVELSVNAEASTQSSSGAKAQLAE